MAGEPTIHRFPAEHEGAFVNAYLVETEAGVVAVDGLLTLSAVFSAEVSTCDAILFMLSSSVSIDLYQTFFRRAAADRRCAGRREGTGHRRLEDR